MDNGYLAPGETLEDEYDVVRPLLPHEIIGIMDRLLCHEVKFSPTHTISVEQLIQLNARWHGIKETLFLRRYSLRSILTNCFQHHQKCWRMRISFIRTIQTYTGVTFLQAYYISFSEPTV